MDSFVMLRKTLRFTEQFHTEDDDVVLQQTEMYLSQGPKTSIVEHLADKEADNCLRSRLGTITELKEGEYWTYLSLASSHTHTHTHTQRHDVDL